MAVYNRGPEKREYREPVKERENAPRPVTKTSTVEPILHEEITSNIKKLRTQSDLDHFRDVLRNILRSNEINNEEFESYVSKAKQKIEQVRKKESQKQEAQQQSTVTYVNPERGLIAEEDRRERKAELDERRVRGEEIEEESAKKETTWTKIRKAFDFIRSPIGRVSLFIVLGLFLIFYLTRGSMAEVIDSPFIIILAVLFIILILGRGGKTRPVEQSSNWF